MTATPVFVDSSGRRARLVRGACWALASVSVGYVLLVIVALVAPPDVLSLRLPGLPGGTAPPFTTSDGATHEPEAVASTLPTPVRRTPNPVAPRPSRAPATRPTGPSTPAPGRPTTSPRPSASGAPSSSPSPPGRGNGRPTSRPTTRATPSKPPHP